MKVSMCNDSKGAQGESSAQSVTQWIFDLKRKSDEHAAQAIWDRYVTSLIRIARQRLGNTSRRVSDEEDIVAVAFSQFFARVEQGGFSRLDDRDDLWQILVMLTERRAIDQVRGNSSRRPQTFGDSVFGVADSQDPPLGLDHFPGDQPSPRTVLITMEEFRQRIHSLDDATLQSIAIAKMNGNTNQQIADRLDVGLRSVERKLQLIRQIWQRERRDEKGNRQ